MTKKTKQTEKKKKQSKGGGKISLDHDSFETICALVAKSSTARLKLLSFLSPKSFSPFSFSNLVIDMIIGNRTSCRPSMSVCLNKSDSGYVVVHAANHSYNYKGNWTPLSPVIIIIVSITKCLIVIGSPRAYLIRNWRVITRVSNYSCPI